MTLPATPAPATDTLITRLARDLRLARRHRLMREIQPCAGRVFVTRPRVDLTNQRTRGGLHKVTNAAREREFGVYCVALLVGPGPDTAGITPGDYLLTSYLAGNPIFDFVEDQMTAIWIISPGDVMATITGLAHPAALAAIQG